MNKTMIAAAAAMACGIAFGDGIASANVVGYQNKSLDYAKNTFVSMTMIPVGVAGSDVTLGSFVPVDGENGWNYYTDKLCVLKSNGNIDKEYGYFSAYWANEFGDPSVQGWYPYSEVKAENPKNRKDDVSIPFGTGVLMYSSMNGMATVFSGEVCADDFAINVTKGANTFVGISRPTDCTLGELEPTDGENGWNYYTDKICLLNSNGTVKEEFGYFSAYWANEFGDPSVKGWYPYSEVKGENPKTSKNSVVIPSGQGFLIYSSMANIQLPIPSALP